MIDSDAPCIYFYFSSQCSDLTNFTIYYSTVVLSVQVSRGYIQHPAIVTEDRSKTKWGHIMIQHHMIA